jgi:hypothetical protein
MVLPQTHVPPKGASPHAKFINKLPEVKQQNGFLSLRKRFRMDIKSFVARSLYQWAPERRSVFILERRAFLPYYLRQATFLNRYGALKRLRCCDKKCNHSMFVRSLPLSLLRPSPTLLKDDFKRMRFPVHVILKALSMFYLGKNSFAISHDSAYRDECPGVPHDHQ